MKKFYVLLSVMVLALMTAGFSYAYWSDTLTVSGSATTGSFDVDFQAGSWDDVAYVVEAVTESDDALDIVLTNMYPGASFTYTGSIVNNSTIPVETLGFYIESGDLRGDDWDTITWLDVSFSLEGPHSLDVGESVPFTITISIDPLATEAEVGYYQSLGGVFKVDYGQFNDPQFNS